MQLCVFFCERDNIDIRVLLSQLEIMHMNVNELSIELVRLDRLSLTNFILTGIIERMETIWQRNSVNVMGEDCSDTNTGISTPVKLTGFAILL